MKLRISINISIIFLIFTLVMVAHTQPAQTNMRVRVGEPFDPDDTRSFNQMVQDRGYPVEWHNTTTEDGYILSMARIPNPGKPPILLVHGFLDNCFSYIFNYHAYQNLAMILYDQGFDVWLGNNRGNTFSKHHVSLDPDSEAFWQFSIDEMALYDVPAFLRKVISVSGEQDVIYIGHSEGTSQFMAYASMAANVADAQKLVEHVPLFIALGPVAHVRHAKGVVVDIFRDTPAIDFVEKFGNKQFMPTPETIGPYLGDLCRLLPDICLSVVEMIVGWHHGSLNASRQQVMATHEPGGSSVKNMLHWNQLLRKDEFSKFDWGSDAANIEHYNQSTPPIYDILAMNVTTALFYGTGDLIVDKTDLDFILSMLPNVVFSKSLDKYSHLDYLWCTTAYIDLYKDVVSLVKKYSGSSVY